MTRWRIWQDFCAVFIARFNRRTLISNHSPLIASLKAFVYLSTLADGVDDCGATEAAQMTRENKSNVCEWHVRKAGVRSVTIQCGPPHITAIYFGAVGGAAWCFIKTDDRGVLNGRHIAGAWRCGVTDEIVFYCRQRSTPTATPAGGKVVTYDVAMPRCHAPTIWHQ